MQSRRRHTFLSVAAAIALLAVAIVTAIRLAPAPVAAEESITVIEHASTDTVLDQGDKGDSIGDSLVFANDVYDANDANVVGSDQGSCVRTKPGKAWECTFTVILDNGNIVVQGPFNDEGDSTLAITGGTGDYANATGEMKLSALDGGEKYKFEFDVR
ncbi:MAG: dirigent protein [Thermomicrobiales bacterium]